MVAVALAEFLPDVTRMNANPENDIQEFFQGREEYARLRVPTPEEQARFAAYDFDYSKDQHILLQSADFDFQKNLTVSDITRAHGPQHDLDDPDAGPVRASIASSAVPGSPALPP